MKKKSKRSSYIIVFLILLVYSLVGGAIYYSKGQESSAGVFYVSGSFSIIMLATFIKHKIWCVVAVLGTIFLSFLIAVTFF